MEQNHEYALVLQQMREGSREAFDQFYEEHIEFVFQIAFQMMGEQGEAEDICHDVFLEVLQKPGQYNQERGSVKAWLAVKTRSRALDRLRKKKPVLVDTFREDDANSAGGADFQVMKRWEKNVIQEALKQIPEEQREAIYRSYYLGETHKTIATTMKKPLGSVKSLIRYGLHNIRKQKSIVTWAKSSGGGSNHES